MNMADYLATGKRRCKCDNVTLIVESYEYRSEKPYSYNTFKHLAASAVLGIRYYKPVKKYHAICSQCNKPYLYADTKRDLLQKITTSTIPIQPIPGKTK